MGRPRAKPGPAGVDATGVLRTHLDYPGATPATLFAAWSTIPALKRWWIEEGAMRFVPGGRYVFRFAGGKFELRGRFLEIVPATRLVMTWCWVSSDGKFPYLTELEFSPRPGGARLAVAQRGFDPKKDRDEIVSLHEGWAFYLPRLALALAPRGRRRRTG